MTRITSDAPACPDLSPYEDYSIEWWFAQGFIQGKEFRQRKFMVALFRTENIAESNEMADSGMMLLVSVLDPATGRHEFHSRISPAIIANYRNMAREFCKARFPLLLVDSVVNGNLKEAASDIDHGRIVLDESRPEISSHPFHFQWSGFAFRQLDGSVELALTLPGEDQACSLTLRPQAPWLHEPDINLTDRGPVAYVACPRLTISGTRGGEDVTGRAWIDHQWGDYFGWLIADRDDGYHPFGWDWFGINLDDGTDLLLETHRYVNSSKRMINFAYIFRDGRIIPIRDEIALVPTGYWRSPHTMHNYPLYWRLDIPQLEINLDFAPLSLDQEIPVFGMNAIWEGAGLVNGMHKGRPVRGEARLELHGYGYVVRLRDYLFRRFNRFVNRYGPASGARKASQMG